MKILLLSILSCFVIGCSTTHVVWRVRDLALAPTPTIGLHGRKAKIVATMNTQTMQRLLLTHIRISRSAGVQSELLITEGEEPNAFVGLMSGRRVTAINTGMIKLIGEDMDEYAALLAHETAHWAKGHVDKGTTRSNTIQGLGTLLGVGLAAAGVPGAGTITGLGADLIDASFSRDDEREADATSIEYIVANGFDPMAAVRLHEKMLQQRGGLRIPFLSSHPSGTERVENLRKLIEARQLQR